MMNHRNVTSLALVPCAIAVVLYGCGDSLEVICTGELRTTLAVEVRNSVTGTPAARGVTGTSEHESGVLTELTASDDLRLGGDWAGEFPGTHSIQLKKPGYETESMQVFVDSNGCHVEPLTVQATITPDSRAVLQDPVSFVEGPGIDAYPPNAGVQIYADTLEITGFVPTDCNELRVVAFRVGEGLHVQVEPSDALLGQCVSPRMFNVRYTLPPERTYLLVTNGFSFPVTLFDGQVRPS
jgi:hypothetical protein